MRHSLHRFLASGILNILASYALYRLLLDFMVMTYAWAYSISWLVGLGVAYGLQRYYVFRQTGGRFGLLWGRAIYLAQYLLGLALGVLWVRGWGLPQIWAPGFSIMVSFPLTYLASRRVFRAR